MAAGMPVILMDPSTDLPSPSSSQVATTAGGQSSVSRIATADTNAQVLKASAGRVFGWAVANLTASPKFVKLYNKASAPNPAADVPVLRIVVPANGVAAFHTEKGFAGFTQGIAMLATGALADTDATALAAGDIVANVFYG